MAQNRAAEELAALTQAAAQPVNTNAQRQADEGLRAGASAGFDAMDMEGGAGFAFPEALATAVGAGWILGPIGGLALGIAQGILGKREKQNALDKFAAEQDVISGVSDVIGDELNRMHNASVTDEDREMISGFMTQKEAAIKFMSSASPRLQEQGAGMLENLYTEMNGYNETQEVQRMEAEAFDAQLRRDLDEQGYERFKGMKVRFNNDSKQYEDTLAATNTAIDALTNGSPAQLWAAGILVNKALDPTGIVRQEEAEAVGALGNLWTKGQVIMEKAFTGKTILPQERKDLQELLGTIQGNAAEIQLAREARYLTELEDAQVPQKYWDNFTLVDSVPAAQPGRIDDTGIVEKGADALTVPVTNVLEKVLPHLSDQALMEMGQAAMDYTLGDLLSDMGLDDMHQPKSLEELAKTNPRVKRALPHN